MYVKDCSMKAVTTLAKMNAAKAARPQGPYKKIRSKVLERAIPECILCINGDCLPRSATKSTIISRGSRNSLKSSLDCADGERYAVIRVLDKLAR